jgi:hypothetical protein
MAPSAVQAHLTTSASSDPWCHQNQQNHKENQRPPVFFPEDYVVALKKFSRHGSSNGNNGNSNANKSIYDTIDDLKNEQVIVNNKSRTLPLSKNSDYK